MKNHTFDWATVNTKKVGDEGTEEENLQT